VSAAPAAPDELLAAGKQPYGWTLMIAKLEGGNANALTCRQAAIAIQSLSAANAALAARCEKVAADMEKWWLDDGIRPDEWKLQEWVRILRQSLASQAEGERADRS
jgi:hypothetical protein